MLVLVAYTFLALFAVSLIITYVLARQERLPVIAIAVIGLVGSTLALFAYKLMIGGTFGEAMILGLGLGFLFTLAALSIGVFFTANAETEGPNTPES